MFSVPEQFSNATKVNFETQIAMITSLTNKAFENIEKVIALNIHTAKAAREESTAAARQLLAAKDAQEFFSLTSTQAKPTAEKALAYSRNLANITSNAQAEFTKVAETQIADTNRKVLSLIEDVTKNAPAGSENVVAIFKSAIGNASAGYDQMTKATKATKQAVETLETNMNTAASKFTDASRKVSSAAKK